MPDRDDPPYEGLVEWEPGQPLVFQTAPPAPARRVPWHRNPRVLLGLIVTAVVPLVVASVVLVAGGSFDDDEVRLRPTLRPSSTRVTPPKSTPEPSTTPETTETTPETTGEGPSGPGAVGAPETTTSQRRSGPGAVGAPETSEGPAAGESDRPARSRGPVTRGPRSFTPGGAAGG